MGIKQTDLDEDPAVAPVPSQTHTHEFLGSTMLAGPEGLIHNHRFAGVTSEAIPLPGGNHKHGLLTNTDFVFAHLHEITAETGPAIPVSENRHVHFVQGTTTLNRGHTHNFIFATLIDSPLENS
ncbi:MAG: YmaF family protein [Clostridia bacterium]|jgi:hypothetical protein